MTVLDPVIQYLSSRGKGRRVRLDQVVAAVERPRRPVLRVMDKLAAEGYLVEIADDPIMPAYGECGPPRRNPTWKIITDPMSRPARPAPRRQSARARIWRVIRAMRRTSGNRFTQPDLVRLSGASRGTVEDYVRRLVSAGYLRRAGKDGRLTVYMLVYDTVEHPRGDRELEPPARGRKRKRCERKEVSHD